MVQEYVISLIIGTVSCGLIISAVGACLIQIYFGFGIMEVIGIALVLYFLFPILFYFLPWVQRHLVFMNAFQWRYGTEYFEPSRHGIAGGRNFSLSPEPGVEIGVWQILQKSLVHVVPSSDAEWTQIVHQHRNPIVIYFHGNTGNRASDHRVDLYKLLQSLDYQVIAFDYRGYGDSVSSQPLTESGLVADSACVYQWVLNAGDTGESGTAPIFFWAHSLGTGISIHLTSKLCSQGSIRRPPSGVILEAPFTSMADVTLTTITSLIYRPLPGRKHLLTSKFKENDMAFESDLNIKKVTTPLLFLHAKLDMVVPFSLGEKLHRIALNARPDDWERILFKAFDGRDRSSAHVLIWAEPTLIDILSEFTALASPRNKARTFSW